MRALQLAVPAAALLLSACSGSSNAPATAPSSTPNPTGPPHVSEVFTPLPCKPGTTIGQEGCAEHAVLRADVLINRDLKFLWRHATAAQMRRHLVDAQTAWMAYRKTVCLSEADAYQGGSLSTVIDARCLARITNERARQLKLQRGLAP